MLSVNLTLFANSLNPGFPKYNMGWLDKKLPDI